MNKKIGRRDFFRKSAQMGFSAALGMGAAHRLLNGSVSCAAGEQVDIAAVSGSDYYVNTLKAVESLGGVKKWIPKDSKVALLPNSQSSHPGTFTKPQIIQAVVQMCKEAGAKEVNCLTWLKRENWEASGLAEAVEKAGAHLVCVQSEETNFRAIPVPGGKALKEAMIMKPFFNHDVFIDMPITKDHAGNKFTGTMKNLMGLNFRTSNRLFHKQDWTTNPESIAHLDQCIVDLNKVASPALCVVDATEFITTNGPFGPGKLIKPKKVVAGKDRVAIDAYCAALWGLKGEDLVQIKRASEQGLGEINLEKVRIKEIKA